MKQQVLAFIDYMRSEIAERPQCYLFALMLKNKFGDAVIYSSMGHCITEIGGQYYDWDGVTDKTNNFLKFPEEYGDKHMVNYYYAIKEIMSRN